MAVIGNNVKSEVNGNILTLTIDLSAAGGKSKSGKNILIASTMGNKTIEHAGGSVSIGLNVYRPTAEGE